MESWYDRHAAAMANVEVRSLSTLPPNSGWAVDPASGKTFRPDGKFFTVEFFGFHNSGQEVPSYIAPKVVEIGKGVVLNIARKLHRKPEEYLLHAKPEAGKLHAAATLQASESNLASGKVPFASVLADPDFRVEEVEIEQDLGRMHGKVNRHILAQLNDTERDVMELIGDTSKVDAYRWCNAREIQRLLRTRQHSVSPHLLEWMGAFTR